MSTLSSFGLIHTSISLIAVVAGVAAFARYGAITAATRVGRLYILTTVLTCINGLFIFAHGGFGKPHALSIITLLVIAIAGVARLTRWFERRSLSVETIAYSLTFFFHLIPAITETSTRLASDAPLLDSPDAPELQIITGSLFVLFLIGAVVQVRRLRRETIRTPFVMRAPIDF